MADKGRLTTEQRSTIVLLFHETKSVIVAQRRFRAQFHTRWAPSNKTIHKLYEKFRREGTILEPKRPRQKPVCSPENIEAVRVAMQRSPGKSTRKAAVRLGISRRSVQRILKSDLHMYPYKMTVVHRLTNDQMQERLVFAYWAEDKQQTFNNVWFSDEAHFHLDGVVNKQNVRFWANENPRLIHEKDHHAPRITVWVAISSHGLIGPFFFEKTVNSDRYLTMLRNNFVPQLLATALPINTQWFMQDGARPHTANIVLDFLHEIFNMRVISDRFPNRFHGGQSWPPHSPDLNPCDYFLWGYLKEKIFPKQPQTLIELRRLIVQACNEIDENVYRRVVNNLHVRLDAVQIQNGGHIEHVLH